MYKLHLGLFFLLNSLLINCEVIKYLNFEVNNEVNITKKYAIFCKQQQSESLKFLWAKSYLSINDSNAINEIFTGYSNEDVENQMSKWISLNYYYVVFSKSKINLPLYYNYCVGIKSDSSFNIRHDFDSFNFKNFFLFCLGLSLFFSSFYLSKQLIIYYSSYVLIGTIGSVLVLTIILVRYLPKKTSVFVFFCGSFVNTYLISVLKDYVFTYPIGFYLLIYVLISAVVSFSYAYYKGPTTNLRVFNLLKWFIQFCSVIIMFLSSEYTKMISIIIFFITLIYNKSFIDFYFNKLYVFESSLFNSSKQFLSRFKKFNIIKPRPPKLLTVEEFNLEGQIETQKALNELRKFCKSPKCDKWGTLRKLKNPRRFSDFIYSGDHLLDEEIIDYETELAQLTDDDSS